MMSNDPTNFLTGVIRGGGGKTLNYLLVAAFAFAMSANMTVEARSITGVERVAAAGAKSLNVTFEAGETGDAHALYIAYDTEDKGDNIANWAALQRGCVVADNATSATIPVSPLLTGEGYTFCRVFLTTSAAPYDTLIESLRQTGTQYIDTGIKPSPTSVAVIDTKFDTGTPLQQRFFCVNSDGSSGDYAKFSFDVYINGKGYFASACRDGTGDFKSTDKSFTTSRVRISLSAAEKHRIVITNLATSAQIIDKKWSTTCTKTSTASLLVFAQHYVKSTGATVNNIANGAYLYGFQMTTNSLLACDYKPCKLGGRAGVYDTVTGNIRYSASGTDFDAANSGSPVACSLLAGEAQLSAAPSATGLFSDYTWRGTAVNWGGADAWTKDGDSTPVTWADGNNAIFATANATATLAADVTANAVAFSADATIATNGTDAATLAVKSVSVDSGVSATISAPTSGALEKTGAGTLTFAENRADATTVTAGTLKMDGATVVGLTLGTDGGEPVTFDYGGQELVKNTRDYLVTGSTVTLTNGVFSTASGDDLNIRDDTFTMPSVLTIARDAVVRQGATGKSVYIVNTNGTATINVVGGTLGNTGGCASAYLQHKSSDGGLKINVTDGGLVYFPCTVYALCGNNTVRTTPSLYMTFSDSAFVAGTFNFGNIYNSDSYAPTAPTAVFAATNSIVSVDNDFFVGRNKQDSKTDGSYTVDFENCTVTAKTFTVYYDRPLNNARFNDTRFVFNAASGSIVANDGAANWFTVGADGLTLDTQEYSATLDANLGGSGAVTKVGAGTLTVARDQATAGGFNVSEGTLAPNAGLTFTGTVSVANGATLTVNATATTSASGLTLASGATLDIVNYDGTTPLSVSSLTLPESGTANLKLSGGAFGEGVYTICSATGLSAADGDKFSFDLAIADLIHSWSVMDGALVLTLRATAQIWNGAAGQSVPWADGWTGGAWGETHDAMFNTAGAIASVDADVSANAVKFNESATVNGSATLTPRVVFVAEGKEATINAPTAGALEKTGAGSLTLTEDRADATTVTEGTLKMDGAIVAGLTLGTAGGAPVTFDYGGQELVKNTRDYLVTGSTVTLTNGIFATASGDDLNIRDDTFTMPSVLTIAKDAVVRQGATGKSVYINNIGVEARTINVIGGTLGNTEGCASAFLQHKSPDARLNINVVDGGLVYLPCTVYALCGGGIDETTPSLFMTSSGSTFSVGGTFYLGNNYSKTSYVPAAPTGVFAATNSVVSVGGDGFLIGRNTQDAKTDGSYTVDFEDCTVTAKTFAVYYDRPLNNARFNDTRFVFNAASGSIAASDGESNWITVGADGLTLDTQEYSATLNANLGGSGAVTKTGAGTLIVARNQTSTAAFNVGEGTLSLNAGLTVNRPIAVASGAILSVNAANTTSVHGLSLAAGSTLNIASYTLGVMPLTVTALTLPESGTVNLTLNGGVFTKGVYAIYSNNGVTAADGAKFAPLTGELGYSWSVEGNILLLNVGEVSGNYWTGRGGDGRMSTAANWLNGVPAAGADIDLSFISSATTIIADAERTFGAVTMGDGVITFTNALTVAGFSDPTKVTIAADSTVTIDNDVTLDATPQRLCYTIMAGGTLHITGSVEIKSSSIIYALYSGAAAGAIIVDGGIAVSGNGTVWWNSKVLALGENGISFTDNAPFLFTVEDAEVYALGERTVLGTEGRGRFRSRYDDVSLCTTQYGSNRPATITIEGNFNGVNKNNTGNSVVNFNCWGHWRATGSGRVVCTSAAQSNRGLRVYDGATLAFNPNTATFGQSDQTFYVYNTNGETAGGTLEVASSGKVTLTGDLALADGTALGFNFTERATAPQLALASGKTLSFTGDGATNITVKVSGSVWPRSGEHQLTTCGGFGAEGVTVSLAEGAPKWATGLTVNGAGNIVLSVKPKGMVILFK